ncbi:hypothetical protein [uncultured Pelagimonas sp.]|uniref:hypothetical protein n=1 Tax=uncultured Pelagimonas sp. TaxID=1618102 RepID=UPI00260D6C09|nr:hypothetical protein [uncultured Pelagimonas sp.]
MHQEVSGRDGEFRFGGDVSLSNLRSIRPDHPLESLYLEDFALLHRDLALELVSWPGIETMVLNGPVTRQAMRQLVNIPSLSQLEVKNIHQHGRLDGLDIPTRLASVKIGFGASAKDIFAVAKGKGLAELSLEHSFCSTKAMTALSTLPLLKTLHLEGALFTDEHAAALSKSSGIRHLYVQTTQIGREGLADLCRMEQLETVDLWATGVKAEDLALLQDLPNLTDLSVGQFEDEGSLTAEDVLPRIAKLKGLKRIWLDGITLSQDQKTALQERYDHVQSS